LFNFNMLLERASNGFHSHSRPDIPSVRPHLFYGHHFTSTMKSLSMMRVFLHIFLIPILLLSAGKAVSQHSISSDVGTNICKGTVVTMTSDLSNGNWEISRDNGASWNFIGYADGSNFSYSNIANNDRIRQLADVMDFSDPFNPSFSTSTSNELIFTVTGEKAGINTISSPDRGSISLNGNDQGFLLTPGFAVNTGAFTFETWFRLNDAPKYIGSGGMYVLLGAGDNFKAVSIIIADPTTIKYDSWGYASTDFTVPKMELNTWYHLVMVRDASRNLTVFLNGTRSSTGLFTNTSDMTNNTGAIRYIGYNPDGNRFNGLISNLRMVVGTALYDPTQSSIAVPNAPLSSVTNTKLLLLANSSGTKATDASGIQTLSASSASPDWFANSPFRETVTANRTLSNSVSGGSWSSSNTGVATVNASTGEVTPVANGNVNITYAISSGSCTSADVTLLSVSMPCTTNTWSGGSGNWNVAGNWSCGSVPDGSTDISIASGTPTMNVDFTLPSGKSLTISGSGALTIAAGKALTIAGTADFGGKSVTLKSDATGTARLGAVTGTLSNATNVTVERYLPLGRKWRFLTAPLKGSSNNSIFYNWQNNDAVTGSTGVEIWGTGGDVNPSSGNTGMAIGGGASMRSYGGSGWANVTNTNSTLLFDNTTNYGYALFAAGPYNNGSSVISPSTAAQNTILSATGTLITGDHTKSFNATSPGQYFLVGNPYASPVDPRSFTATGTVNRTNLYSKLWMWDAKPGTGNGLGHYVSFDLSINEYSPLGYGYPDHNVMIQSGQAFFVQATNSGAATLVFRETSKNGSGTNGMMGNTTEKPKARLRLTLQQSATGDSTDNLDGAVAVFHEDGRDGIDPFDGSKMMNGTENIFLRREDRSLTFEHRPIVTSTDTLYLRMSNLKTGVGYRLQAEAAEFPDTDGVTAELIDRFTGRPVPLSLTGKTGHPFTVTADSLSTGDRFLVVFRRAAAPVVVTPDRDANGAGLKLYPNPARDNLQVSVNVSMTGSYKVQVVSSSGEQVWMCTDIASGTKRLEINTSGLVSGVYHLVLTDAQGGRTVRKFVKE
jgi:hypothetical protein